MIAYIVKLLKELGAVVLGLVGPLNTLKSDFNSWKTDWTSSRAEKLDTIESRLSNPRANKLDNLNRPLDAIETAVNTKASQTSVDAVKSFVDDLEARLTSTRASKLDNLDARVSTKANQTTADNIYSKVVNGFVKRVQRGLIGGTQSTTIQLSTLVNTNYAGESLKYIDVTLPYSLTNTSKAVATCEHAIFTTQSSAFSGVACNLINGNTLRIYIRNQSLKNMDVITWQVVEYY